MEIQIFVDEKEVIKFVWPNSLAWPDQFFSFCVGSPTQHKKKKKWSGHVRLSGLKQDIHVDINPQTEDLTATCAVVAYECLI